MKRKTLNEAINLIAIAIVGGLMGWLLVVILDKWVAHEQAYQQYIAPADQVLIELMEQSDER